MKKVLLLFFIGIVSISVSAQKCKYDIDKKDKFTGDKVTGFMYRLKTNIFTKLNFYMYRKSDKMMAELLYNVQGEMNESISEGRALSIRLDNNEIITLVTSGTAAPKSTIATTSAQASVSTSYTVFYILEKEFVEKLSKHKPLAIQIEFFDNNTYAEEIKSKRAVKMMEEAKCLLRLFSN